MLEDLQLRLARAPTVMDLAQLKAFIAELMALPDEVLRENLTACSEVLEQLAASYGAGTYFEVVSGEKVFFLNFAAWIKSRAEDGAPSTCPGQALESLASVFLVFPEEVYGDRGPQDMCASEVG